MTTVICWVFVVTFVIFFSFAAGLLLAHPTDPISISGAIIIILIGVLTTVNLVLTMPA